MHDASYQNQLVNLKRYLLTQPNFDPLQSVHHYAVMLLDTSETELAIEKEARKVLGDWVDGTTFFVPGPEEIVEELVVRVKWLEERVRGLENKLSSDQSKSDLK